MVKPLRKAVLPVAGLGTRFLPATKAMPKEMLPVVDKPLIQYAVDEARAAGIEQFCMVTGRGKTALIDHFDIAFELEATLAERNKREALDLLRSEAMPPGSISTVRQQVPLGLGHAIWCARTFIGDDPFAILLPDDLVLSDTPCMEQLADVYRETGGNVVAVTEVPHEHTNRYGILKIGAAEGNRVEVEGLVEKPAPKDAPSNLSIIGRYILLPEVVDASLQNGTRRWQRSAADRRDGQDDRPRAVPRPEIRGQALRLRRQGRLSGSADRLRAGAAGSRAGGARNFSKTT